MSGKGAATGAIIGAALAPFTGGLSLGLTTLGSAVVGGAVGSQVLGKGQLLGPKKSESPAPQGPLTMPTPDSEAVRSAQRRKASDVMGRVGTAVSTQLTPEKKLGRNQDNLTAIGYAKKLG